MSSPLSRPPYAFKRKHVRLPYKWPLLADGQDPNALEARLAFHLHRLHFNGNPLREALNGKVRISTALSQARMSISISAISELATILNTTAHELTRDLTNDESREWTFYRRSAHYREQVWANALQAVHSNDLSQHDIARLAGIPQSRISEAEAHHPRGVLDWHQASRLLQAANSDAAPESLLPIQER